MTMNYKITYNPDGIPQATVTLPLSKSMSARRLVIDAVAGRRTECPVADCDDTRALQEALAVTTGAVNIGAAGTALRFLTAYYAAKPGVDVILDGTERIRRRPLSPLIDALRLLGADIEYTGQEGFAPVHIRGTRLSGGSVSMDASASSQFVSAMMMVAPLMEKPLRLDLPYGVPSLPYVRMTAAMMERSGATADMSIVSIDISGAYTRADSAPVERDWSAASYWYEITAFTSGWFTLAGLTSVSVQGDSRMAAIGERLGVITADAEEDEDGNPVSGLELSASPEQFSRIDLDMTDTPDLVPAVVVTAATLGIPFHLTGVENLRLKECDRIEALRREVLKIGVVLDTDTRGEIRWDGSRVPVTELPVFDTYDDHRMAMALAPVAVFMPAVMVRDTEVVTKSYPTYWDDLALAGFVMEEA